MVGTFNPSASQPDWKEETPTVRSCFRDSGTPPAPQAGSSIPSTPGSCAFRHCIDVLDIHRALLHTCHARGAGEQLLGRDVIVKQRLLKRMLLPFAGRFGSLLSGKHKRSFSSSRCLMSMMIFRGERSLPVRFAGQDALQRPHSVQVYPSSSCFHVKSRHRRPELLHILCLEIDWLQRPRGFRSEKYTFEPTSERADVLNTEDS